MKIGFRKTGLGDAWMRFLALSVFKTLRPGDMHEVFPPTALVPLAREIFAGFFDVSEGGTSDIEFSHLGIRHLLPGLLRGEAYHLPFFWLLCQQRPRETVKDGLNDLVIQAASKFLPLSLPERRHTFRYQGFMELQGLQPFRSIEWEEFVAAAAPTLSEIKQRLHRKFAPATEPSGDAIFPSGTAHQIMPPAFAASHYPRATFFFHKNDNYAASFLKQGLRVGYFETPQDIFSIFAASNRVISTESFTSHLAQSWEANCYIYLTQSKQSMIVMPSFPEAQIFRSLAACHPCRSRVRYNEASLCDRGEYYCKTWAQISGLPPIPSNFNADSGGTL